MDTVPATAEARRLADYLGALARTDYLLILGLDPEGGVTYASPGIGVEVESSEDPKPSLFDLVHHDDAGAVRALLEQAPAADAPARCTLRFRNSASGASLWREMDVIAIPVSDDGPDIVLGLRDRGALEPLRRRIERDERRLRLLMARLHAAQEQERRRLAGEVHDVLGQALTALRMDICWMKEQAGDVSSAFGERLDDALDITESTIEKVRTISHELRPGVLDHFGLAAALEWQSGEYEDRFDLPVRFRNETGDDMNVPDEVSIALFRIFQEAFTNVVRHAEASRVTVALQKEQVGGEAPRVRLVVADDGRGFDPGMRADDEKNGSLGILNMRERVLPFGGSLEVDGRPGEGTTVSVTVQLDVPSGGGAA